MKTFFKWLFLAPFVVALAAFAMLNRQGAQVVLYPFALDLPGAGADGVRFEAPLFVVLLGAGALGIVAGSLVTWFGQGKHRRAARLARAECERLRAENESLNARGGGNGSGLPAIARDAA